MRAFCVFFVQNASRRDRSSKLCVPATSAGKRTVVGDFSCDVIAMGT